MSARELLIHIGLERTGSTWLQFFLKRNRTRLLENSLLYPTRNLGFLRNNHARLAASYLPDDPNDVFLRVDENIRPRVLTSIRSEIDRSGARTAILSSEHFSSRFRDRQIHQLAADFADLDCKVVVFAREHMSRLFSCYGVHIAGGGHRSFSEYVDEILHPDNRTVRYAETIRPWEEAFGRENMVVCRHDPGDDVVQTFFEAAGVPLIGRVRADAPQRRRRDPFGIRTNRSLGPRSIECLRLANALVSEWLPPSGVLPPLARRWSQNAFRYWLQLREWARPPSADSGGPSWEFDPGQREQLDRIVRDDECWLAERYGVSFRDSSPFPSRAREAELTPLPSA